MLPVPRIVGFVTGLLGIVTAGVCIWLVTDTVEFHIGIIQISWDGGDSPKVGIAAAVLMIVVGISFCLINPEGRFNFFAGALVIILALSIASMSVAIKDHQDLKKEADILKSVKNHIPPSKIDFDSLKRIKNININVINTPDDILKIYDKMMARLNAVAAVGGIDSIAMIIGVAVLYKYRS